MPEQQKQLEKKPGKVPRTPSKCLEAIASSRINRGREETEPTHGTYSVINNKCTKYSHPLHKDASIQSREHTRWPDKIIKELETSYSLATPQS